MTKNNYNGPYMDLMSDFGFKRLFASEPNKPLLIDFLNQLFKGQKVITDLEYSPTEYLGSGEKERKVFFDLVCTGNKGEKFVVETCPPTGGCNGATRNISGNGWCTTLQPSSRSSCPKGRMETTMS